MTFQWRCLCICVLLVSGQASLAQKNPAAKSLSAKAVADSISKKYFESADAFRRAAAEEMKIAAGDAHFAANSYHRAAQLFHAIKSYSNAHDTYYLALEHYRKAKQASVVPVVLKAIASLYDETRTRNVIYQFPPGKIQETITATMSIDSLWLRADKTYEAIIRGGTNDGVYEGADAEVLGKHRQQGEDRSNRPLGIARITKTYPNYSRAIIQRISSTDTFYNVYREDMVSLPIRFSQIVVKDIFLEVSLMNIRFTDNSREWLAHPRTLMFYPSEQLEKEVYAQMLTAVKEIYDLYKDEKEYQSATPITRGRFKGTPWMQAMGKSTQADLKAFLGFIRSFPGKYMGGTWKISETYATWLLNNAPPGSTEIMDSLVSAKTPQQFNYFATTYSHDIKDNFYVAWQVDIQNMAIAGRFEEALKLNTVLQKVAAVYNDPDLIGWSFFNLGRVMDEYKKFDAAMEAYRKGKANFEKGKDQKGLSYCINNLGYIYAAKYMHKESQQMYEQVLGIRLNQYKQDTSDDQKAAVGRSYWGVGDAYFNQSKYKEAIDQYSKGLAIVRTARSLEARKQTALLSRLIGKSYEKMGEYQPAADFYQAEYTFQKALGDVEAEADALDNQAYLLTKIGKYREAIDIYTAAYNQHLKTGEKNDAGFSMSNIGQTLWSLGKFDSAIAAHNVAISLREQTGNVKGQAYSWRKIGGLYKESGDAVKTNEAYQKSQELYKQTDAKAEYAELLEDIGANYVKQKDNGKAIKSYEEALSIHREMKARDKEATVLSSLGNMYYEDQKYATADELFVQAIVIQKEIKDRSGLMYNYTNRGLVAQYLKEDYKDALTKIRMALALAEETQSEANLAFCQKQMGNLFSYLNEHDSALKYFDKAMAIYRKLEDKENQAGLYVSYGYNYNYRGEFELAKAEFEKALAISKEINNAYSIAAANYGLMSYHYTKGNFTEALARIDEVLKIYREKDNPWGIASVYLDQGSIKSQQGEFDEALTFYYKTDSLYKKLQLEKPRISVTNNIGTIYYQQKNYEAAMKQFQQTKQMLEKFNDDPAFIALIKSNIGEILVDQRKNAEAEKWVVESLEMGRQQKNNRQLYISHLLYGRLNANLKKYGVAEQHFRMADSLLLKGGEKTVSVQLSEAWGKMLFENKQPEAAEKKLLECILLSEQAQYRNYAWKAYSTLADIKLAGSDKDQGLKYLKTAIEEIERIKSKITGADARKIFLSDESVVELYQKMVVQLKRQGRAEEALVYMEKANAENIKLRLNSDDITYDDAATNEALAKEKELRKQQAIFDNQIAKEMAKPEKLQHKEQIAQLEKMRSVTSDQYKAYVTELKIKYPNLAAFKTVDPAEFMAQRRRIPSDIAVVSYLVTEKEMSVFVVMKDTVFVKDIPLDKQLLQKKITNFYAMHARSSKSTREIRGGKVAANPAPPGGDRVQLAAELYDLLIAPLINDIRTKDRIAIVPSGFLCFVPFDALVRKDEKGGNHYFGEDKQLFYVNKISTVTAALGDPLTEFRVMAVGNADKSLPNAEDEVNSLKTKLPKSMVFVRDAATKKNVLDNKGDYNVLHLATHGILDYSNADSSYLVFAPDPGNKDDGRLTIAEIQRRTDIDRFQMVALSACETAVIREVAEGWPISTASAFIEMGVPTVIATLWQVDDKATRILIDKFYDNLTSMDKVLALQQAQLYLRKQPGYDDPYYWAPFQLAGIWK
ncbi:MAG: tetratricopeptide repeat protein [Chitinophagaceae bacterium]|nr:tetratricopeptide repeat protein [Chitinophagaceae bacterium]